MSIYLRLIGTSLIPVVLSIFFYLLRRKTSFGNIKKIYQEIIIGIVFGLYAICSTEFLGIVVGHDEIKAVANARDAGPICAGLFFGGPAGLIAGIIGGVERLISGLLGKGPYTIIACSVSTALAGLIAWAARKFMLENRRPSVVFATVAAIIMEVIHLTLVFVTHLNDTEYAMEIVKICTLPMILANGIALLLSALGIAILSMIIHKDEDRQIMISEQIQKWLLLVVFVAYLLTTSFVFTIQTNTAKTDVDNLLSLNITDIKNSTEYILTEEPMNVELLSKAHLIREEIESDPTRDLNELVTFHGIYEICIADKKGNVVQSTQGYENYNMYEDEQSVIFMELIKNPDVYEVVQSFREIGYDFTRRKFAGVKLSGNRLLQISYDEDLFYENITNEITDLVVNRHIGAEGQFIILNVDGTSLINPLNIELDELSQYDELTSFKTKVNDEKYVGMYQKVDNYVICGFINESDAYKTRNNALYINSFMEVIVFGILFTITYFLIDKLVVKNLKKVNNNLSQISAGKLDVVVDVNNNLEFSNLSTDINKTVDTLKRYIKDAETKMDKELALAKSIQASALPNIFPAYPNIESFDIYASMRPAKEVGGDFYDFYMLDNNRLAFVIADVSGKGIPAAMFMMRSKTLIKNLAEMNLDVNEILRRANNNLCEGNEAEMFVTCWMGILDLSTGHLTYANAGHNPPLLYQKDSGYNYLRSRPGFVLAGLENVGYKLNEIDLHEGDRLFLYTDGVVEATNVNDELFGEERLQQYLNSHLEYANKEAIRGIKTNIDIFAGEREQFDDITMLCVEYFGNEAPRMKEKKFKAAVEELDNVTDFISGELEKANVSQKIINQIAVAAEEIFVNIAHYAYPEGNGDAVIQVSTKDKIVINFIDKGIYFNPLEKEDPDILESADDRKIGGLGIYMVKMTMNEVKYEYVKEHNVLTLIKEYK